MTYRLCGHSKSDACEYRPDSEEEEWAARDPLRVMQAWLLAEKVADEDELEAARRCAHAQIDDAIEFARQSPDPDPSTVADNLFADF